MSRVKDTAVFGGLALGVFALAVLIFAPLIIGGLWYFGRLGFELAVIVLLIIATYAGGG